MTARPRVTTLAELVEESAATDPDAEALVFADGERLTVGALAVRVREHAGALLAAGVAPGDRVALLLPASAELVALLLAVTRIGAVAVPVNARYRADEVRHVVVHSGACLVVTAPPATPGGPDLPDLARRAVDAGPAPELRAVLTLAELRGPTAPDEAVAAALERTRVRDPAVLVYTSGTTAAPKGALLSHEALVRLAAGIAERMALVPTDRVWTAIPLFHGGGITFAIAALTARAAFVHPGWFDPTSTPALLESERVTVALAAFETIWVPVLDRPDWGGRDLHRLRLVMAVGVPERLRAMAARVPQAVHVSCVAMTESSAFLALGRPDDDLEARLTTGGHPMPGMEVPRRRSGDRRRPARGRRGRAALPRPDRLRRLLPRPRGHGRRHRRRRLVPHRRRRDRRRRRAGSPSGPGSRTCSRSAARTSRPPRSRTTC